MEPISVGIRDAKINLSKLLRTVQERGEIVLTHHGRPVGRILPVETKQLLLEERLRRLQEHGVISPFSKKGARKIPPPIPVENELAQRLLKEDRKEPEE